MYSLRTVYVQFKLSTRTAQFICCAMGVSCAPSMLQWIMTNTLRGLDVLVYCDAVLVIQRQSQSTKDHLIQVEKVLERLQSVGFKANLRQSFFIQKSVEYLGY